MSLSLQTIIMTYLSGGLPLATRYANRTTATNPLQYLKQDETSGSTAEDSTANNYDGAYTGVTLAQSAPPMGNLAPNFDGVNDIVNIHSAGLATSFNFDEGCFMVWLRMDAAWNEGSLRYIARIRRDASNAIDITKSASTGIISCTRTGAGTGKTVNIENLNTLVGSAWFSLMFEWSVAGDFIKAYVNGTQYGGTVTGNVASTGSGLSATTTLLGALNTSFTQPHHGSMAHSAIWTTPSTAAIRALGTV